MCVCGGGGGVGWGVKMSNLMTDGNKVVFEFLTAQSYLGRSLVSGVGNKWVYLEVIDTKNNTKSEKSHT